MMDAGRRVQAEGPVTVDVVVVVEERLAPGSGTLEGVEVAGPGRVGQYLSVLNCASI